MFIFPPIFFLSPGQQTRKLAILLHFETFCLDFEVDSLPVTDLYPHSLCNSVGPPFNLQQGLLLFVVWACLIIPLLSFSF